MSTEGPTGKFIDPETGEEIPVDVGKIEKERTPQGTFTHTAHDGERVVFEVGTPKDQAAEG